MAMRKNRVKTTAYPFLPFHIIRCAQLLSSLVVASIMFYFLRELSHDGYRLPWTFILVRIPTTYSIAILTFVPANVSFPLHPRRAQLYNLPPYPTRAICIPQPHPQRRPRTSLGRVLCSASMVVLWHIGTCMRCAELGVGGRDKRVQDVQGAVQFCVAGLCGDSAGVGVGHQGYEEREQERRLSAIGCTGWWEWEERR